MEWTEELEESHRDLSAADLRFRELARRDPELSRRETFRALAQEYREADLYLQPWPVFLGAAKRAEIERAAVGIARLVRGVAERILGNDPNRVASTFGLGATEAALILAPPNGLHGTLSRGDFVDDGESFKCLEFNYSANLGGWETSIAVELHQRIPATVRYLREAALDFTVTDTLQLLFLHVVDEAERKGLAREGVLNVAFVVNADSAAWAGPILAAAMEMALARRGGPVRGRSFICRTEELRETPAGLWLGERRIHAVVEFQTVGIASPGAFRRARKGQVVLFNGPISRILSDKQNLALLSEHQDSGLFTDGERELLERHLPWTRTVSARPVRYRGEEVFLPDLLAAQRERLVLKAAQSHGGLDVALGRETPEPAWAERVRAALAGSRRWIVQEQVSSRPYLFQDGEEGCGPHAAVWGPFVFGDRFAGLFLRVKPIGRGGPIGLDQGGTMGLVLEV